MATVYAEIGELNQDYRAILNLIQKNGPILKRTLLEKTGMKMTKLNRILDGLEQYGVIIRMGNGSSTGGRKPILFDVRKDGRYILSLTMGSIRYHLSIVNLKMEIVAIRKGRMRQNTSPDEFVNGIADMVQDLMEETGIPQEELIGLGVATFGSVDKKTGQIKTQSSFYVSDRWIDYPLKDALEEKIGLPVETDTGANAETMAHYLYGKGRGSRRMISLICGMGIRTGVIIDGLLIAGNTPSDDTFGHMTINMDGRQCKCGNYGCIECYASLSSIKEQFVSIMRLGRTSCIALDEGEEPTVEQLEEACCNNDGVALELIKTGAVALGCGLANYINLFNPDIVLLSGLLIEKSDTYYNTVIETTEKRLACINELEVPTTIIRSDSHSEIFSMAGACMFFEQWVNF